MKSYTERSPQSSRILQNLKNLKIQEPTIDSLPNLYSQKKQYSFHKNYSQPITSNNSQVTTNFSPKSQINLKTEIDKSTNISLLLRNNSKNDSYIKIIHHQSKSMSQDGSNKKQYHSQQYINLSKSNSSHKLHNKGNQSLDIDNNSNNNDKDTRPCSPMIALQHRKESMMKQLSLPSLNISKPSNFMQQSNQEDLEKMSPTLKRDEIIFTELLHQKFQNKPIESVNELKLSPRRLSQMMLQTQLQQLQQQFSNSSEKKQPYVQIDHSNQTSQTGKKKSLSMYQNESTNQPTIKKQLENNQKTISKIQFFSNRESHNNQLNEDNESNDENNNNINPQAQISQIDYEDLKQISAPSSSSSDNDEDSEMSQKFYQSQMKAEKLKKQYVMDYLDVHFIVHQFQADLNKLITKDKEIQNLFQQLTYGLKESEFCNMYGKFIIYCLEKMSNRHVPTVTPAQFASLDVGPMLSIPVHQLIQQELVGIKEADLDLFNQTFLKYSKIYIYSKQLIMQLGGQNYCLYIIEQIVQQTSKLYNYNPQSLMDKIKNFFMVLFEESKESQDYISDIIMQFKMSVSKKIKTDHGEIVQLRIGLSDFFNFKRIAFFQIFRDKRININEAMRAIEKIEKQRLTYFKEMYGFENFDKDLVLIQLLNVIKKSPPILSYFREASKKQARMFLSLLLDSIFGNQSTKEFVQIVNQQILDKPLDANFLLMVEMLIKGTLEKMMAMPIILVKEIEHRFIRIRRHAGVLLNYDEFLDIYWQFDDALRKWIKGMIAQNQLPKSINQDDALSIDFISYVLPLLSSTYDAFCVSDISQATQYYKIKKEYFQFWLKGIKRSLFKVKVRPKLIMDLTQYLVRCYNDGTGKNA